MTSMEREEYINRIKANADIIANDYGVRSLRIFGSVARNEHHEGSDVDVCVEMEPNLFLMVGLKQYLEGVLQCPVDVIRLHNNMNPFLKSQIEKDGIFILRQTSHRLEYA